MRTTSLFWALVLLTSACSGGKSASEATARASATPSAHVVPLEELPPVDANAVLDHTKTLSSDEFEGRGPGTRGEERTVAYLTDHFQKLGLTPGNPDGTFIQNVPLVGITAKPAVLTVTTDRGEHPFRWKDDVMAWTKHVAPSAAIRNSDLVFVGYGVVAPEFNWDDYKGIDVRGKTIVMLINDPPVPDPVKTNELDPKVFGGQAMTYYGRWTYKFETAASKGAAGAIIIHETDRAGYPFEVVQSSWSGEQFDLVPPDKNMGRAEIEAWMSIDAAKDLLKAAGFELEALKKQAATRDFKPVPLNAKASMTISNILRNIASRNVIAKLDGADHTLKDEYVVYTAHWDHLGIGPAVNGDTIYNGAKDNALGTAALLEIARAFKKLSPPPKRTIVFLAVTGEEQGLLGSAYYAAVPLYPLSKTLANINMDGLNVNGRTKDVTLVGFGASDLDDYVRAAATEQGRTVHADAEPEKGFYYRSDHFSFAKEGVPALDPDEGVDFVGKPPDYGRRVRDEYTAHDYHKPSDVVKPDWDMSGVQEDLQLYFAVGARVADAASYPEWKPGNEFKAKRDMTLAYQREVEKWRSQHERDYTEEYVPLSGLVFLKNGVNTAGSAQTADVVLPARTPASIGRFVYQNKRVSFEPDAGAPVTIKGKPVTSATAIRSDGGEEADELAIGDITFWVHESGDRRTIRIRDPQSELARSFAGFRWFPVNDQYRVTAKFIRDPLPHEVKVASLTGDDQIYTTEGMVEFALGGQTIRMRPMSTRPGRFFFIFTDATSGKETYEAARFLYSDLKGDSTVLDFNEAYNPPCAFNPFTTCPLPPPENRLKIAIPAGERAYAKHVPLPRPSR